ncbi:MAG: TIGR01777 family oxidoreductase [Spirochaetota bacterium]
MSKKVIITGGTGFIGSHLTGLLAKKGYEIVILTRNPGKKNNGTSSISYVTWDGKTSTGWGQYVDGAFAIINLAGESIAGPGWTASKKEKIRDSRINAGNAVFEAVRNSKNKPEVLIQGSASGYYGSRGDTELTEDCDPGNGFLSDLAIEWESTTAPVKDMGVRHVIIRTSLVLASSGGFLSLVTLPFNFFVGGHVGSGTQWMPWIHLEDEIKAICWLMESKKSSGAYNLAAPEQLRSREFFKTLGKVMGRPSWFHLPGFLFRTLPGEMADELLLSSARVVPSRLTEEGFQFRFPHLENALQYSLSG